MRFRRMRYAIWLPLAAKAVACLGAAGATKPLAATANKANARLRNMFRDAVAAGQSRRTLRGPFRERRYACSECVLTLDSTPPGLRRRVAAVW